MMISNGNWTKWSTIQEQFQNWTGMKSKADLKLQAKLLPWIVWHKVQLL